MNHGAATGVPSSYFSTDPKSYLKKEAGISPAFSFYLLTSMLRDFIACPCQAAQASAT
jgi:hypothetical protein